MPTGVYKRKNPHPIKGKKLNLTDKQRKGRSEASKGRTWSDETKAKYIKSRKGIKLGPQKKFHKHPFHKYIREIFEYREWRSKVFQRDNWTCQTCQKRGCYLECHHIKRFADIMKEYNIKTVEQAIACYELWDVENGVTLCKDCHNLTKKRKFK